MSTLSTPTIREVIGVRLPRQTWLSPDGRWLAHLETITDWEQNAFRQRVVLTDVVRQQQIGQIDEAVFASQLKWTGDSQSIGYLTRRDGQSVLRKVHVPDGSVLDIASSVHRFTDFAWHPDAAKVIIAEDAGLLPEHDNEFFAVTEAPMPASQHLLVIDLERGETQRFGGWEAIYHVSSLSWSPVGNYVLFTSLPDIDIRVQWQHLLLLELATGRLIRLIDGEHAIFFPVWNEDGTQIAFFERQRCWDDLRGATLTVMHLRDGRQQAFLPQVDIHCQIRDWHGNRILISGQVLDRSLDLYLIATDSGKCSKATRGAMPLRTGASASIAAHGMAYIAQPADRFPEVVLESGTDPAPIRMTDYHAQVTSWTKMLQQQVSWPAADGLSIEGILIDARSNGNSERHPLIVLLHGGPAITNTFDSFFHSHFEQWSPYPLRQWYAQGISIFLPDYRGSSGYGLEFSEAIAGRLGELETSDILRGIDAILAGYGFDAGRIGVAGLSYGGYLTMLLAARYPSRFAAASACCGFVNLHTQLYCSASNMESYFGAEAWDPGKPAGFLSPLSYVNSNCPPMLLQTGEVDRIVPPAHSTAFYRFLRKHGGTVKLVSYKNCGHRLDHPEQLRCAQQHNLEWFGKWLQP